MFLLYVILLSFLLILHSADTHGNFVEYVEWRDGKPYIYQPDVMDFIVKNTDIDDVPYVNLK